MQEDVKESSIQYLRHMLSDAALLRMCLVTHLTVLVETYFLPLTQLQVTVIIQFRSHWQINNIFSRLL